MTLGTPTYHRINDPADTVASFTAPNWNPHLPKMTSYGGWNYVLWSEQRDGAAADYANRQAVVYQRKQTEVGWHRTPLVVNNYANLPAIVADRAGRFYLAFGCLATCFPGGVNDQGILERYYALIWDTFRDNGAFDLRTETYQNYDENRNDNLGYHGLATDPSSEKGLTYASMAYMDTPGDPNFRSQWTNELRTYATHFVEIPRTSGGDFGLYPMMPMSYQGTRYILTADFAGGASTSWKYGSFSLKQWSNQESTPLVEVSVSSPTDSGNSIALTGLRFAYPWDASFDPAGKLYLTYGKETGACKSFLIKETALSSGVFTTELDIGCRAYYPQIQVSSTGTIYLVEASDRAQQSTADGSKVCKLIVSYSTNGGTSWTSQNVVIPTDNSVTGFPSTSVDTVQPQLTKPWTDPAGYNPDVLHGTVSNALTGSHEVNAMIEFSIPVT